MCLRLCQKYMPTSRAATARKQSAATTTCVLLTSLSETITSPRLLATSVVLNIMVDAGGMVAMASVIYLLPNCTGPEPTLDWYSNCAVAYNGNGYYNADCTRNTTFKGTRRQRNAVAGYKCTMVNITQTVRFKRQTPGKPDYIIKCPKDAPCNYGVALYVMKSMREVDEVGYGTCADRLRALTQCKAGFNLLKASPNLHMGLVGQSDELC
ncbi:ORF103 [Ranid herpesvirus 2]|uniref:ORF103 n=1 Tax=Ranid herpesvirus 2 TaxID=389214 RepID=Q14W03_9VIRU|nr:ORF103 [Ranid herpesvirus 2]ABG25677.1 ORF103 [Ranid herpesvirus 2]